MKETIIKYNKTKSWFFQLVNKTDSQPDSSRKKEEEKNQINKIRNRKGEDTTDNTKIQRVIREYYKQLYANKMGNPEEMDRFFKKFNLPRLTGKKKKL